jgi:hypothetical protein
MSDWVTKAGSATYYKWKAKYGGLESSELVRVKEGPAYDIEALIQVAFRGKIIKDLEHSVVQSLLGRI